MRAVMVGQSELGALMVCASLAWPVSAQGYNCSRVKEPGDKDDPKNDCPYTGPSLAWSNRTIVYTFFAAGTAQVPGDQEFDVVSAAFTTWQNVHSPTQPELVDDISFVRNPVLSTVDRVGYDFVHPSQNENLIIFRDDAWDVPADTGPTSEILALTTTTYKALTGELIDADIEFNTFQKAFSADASLPGYEDTIDLQSVATHEIGHLLGLGHTEVPNSTMNRNTNPGDTSLRTLGDDDREAIVFKYPANGSNGYCHPAVASCGFCAPPDPVMDSVSAALDDPNKGCSSARSPGALAGLVLGWLLLLRLRLAVRRHVAATGLLE